VTTVVCNNATPVNAPNNTNLTSTERIFSRLAETRQWTEVVNNRSNDQHCLEITQGQTYYLLNENYPDEVVSYVSNEFQKDVSDGSYLATYVPEPSKSAISRMYPSSSSEDNPSDASNEAALKPDQASTPVSVPFTPDSIVGTPDDSGGSNTGAIAAGVSVALIVAMLGFFLARRPRNRDDESFKDDDSKDLGREDIETSRRKRNISS
jgi:hypothetical protein